MRKLYTLAIFCLLLSFSIKATAQQDRIQVIQDQLAKLSASVPGLNDKVHLSVNGVSLQEFVSALAKSNNLSLSVDPKLNVRVVNNFNDVTAINILVFLAKTYNLDVSLTGSIITIGQYIDPGLSYHPVKPIKASYNQADNTLNLELDN